MARNLFAAFTRRRLIGGAGALSLVPGALPAPTHALAARDTAPGTDPAASPLELALELQIDLGPVSALHGPDGLRSERTVLGGRFEGSGLRGEVLAGGSESRLERPDGVTTTESRYALRTTDGEFLTLQQRGTADRSAPEFQVPAGRHEWLNRALLAGVIDATRAEEGRLVVRVFRATQR